MTAKTHKAASRDANASAKAATVAQAEADGLQSFAPPPSGERLSGLERAKRRSVDLRGVGRGRVKNGRPGFQYYSFSKKGLSPLALQSKRQELEDLGYDPLPSGSTVYVVGATHCEVWQCDAETADFHHMERFRRAMGKPNWVLMQMSRTSNTRGMLAPDLLLASEIDVKNDPRMYEMERRRQKTTPGLRSDKR